MGSGNMLHTAKSVLGLLWWPKAWKEQIILMAHTVPFFIAAFGAAELLGYTPVGFFAVGIVCMRGGYWLMSRWYDSEVLIRAE